MNIHTIDNTGPLWLPAAEYASKCSWDACARLAVFMKENKFTGWEQIFIAEENGNFMGFCSLIKPQNFPGAEYAPLLKWLFVSEEYRGKRLSQKLIEAAAGYAKKLGFGQIYLTTWHKGLYEKYGFIKLCEKEVREGYSEGIYVKTV